MSNKPILPGSPGSEPWMRGTLTDVHPVLRAVLHSLEQAQEDVERWCGPLSKDELNARPFGTASAAFHVRHAAGSVDRLLTYAEGSELSPEQFETLKREGEPVDSFTELNSHLRVVLARAAKRVRNIDVSRLEEPRTVGRKKLPTTLAGLLIHTAEHTQRHIGEMIVTVKAVKAGL